MILHAPDDDFAPGLENPAGHHPILLVCEHASANMPRELRGLGLGAADLDSHIAWDPGAFATANGLSAVLDAPLVYSTVSRLVYDCNRPPEAASAMPERSEDTVVPGNVGLALSEKQARVERFYRPFEALLPKTLDARRHVAVLVTIHSFTPVYRGQERSVEIGILHDKDSRLADALLKVASGYEIARNAPYGPEDGVTHTLCRHAVPRGLLNVMIEIRNDLIATPDTCARMAETLAVWLGDALELCATQDAGETAR